jgi:hypothetical protein
MDVEKIQKINDLALKLHQQGNLSREEAVKQAETMISKNSEMEINEISSQKLKEMETSKPESNISWQEAMKKNTDFIVKQFKDIQKEMINMKAEMDNLHHKIKNISLAPPPQKPSNESEKGLENSGNSQRQETQKPLEEKPEEHPIQGDSKPEDVCIEKMFYFGNK